MNKGHRPYWILRHRVTGEIKQSPLRDVEDAMWEVCLTDGAPGAVTEQEGSKATTRGRASRSRRRSRGR